MKRWFGGLVALVRKELKLELRGKESVTLLFCNAVLSSALIGVGTSSAFLDRINTMKIFPMVVWILFLLSTSASVVRAYEQELENRGFEGLLLAGATGPQMYLAKLLASSALFFVHFALLVTILAVALDQPILTKAPELLSIGLGGSTAVAAVTVLLSAVAGTSRMRGVLLPLLSLPLLFPVFFAGVELTAQVVVAGGIDASSPWAVILACTNALYVVLGVNLFEFAIRD